MNNSKSPSVVLSDPAFRNKVRQRIKVEFITRLSPGDIIDKLEDLDMFTEIVQYYDNSQQELVYGLIVNDPKLCKKHKYQTNGYCRHCDEYNELAKELGE